jgi:hypothetical protein
MLLGGSRAIIAKYFRELMVDVCLAALALLVLMLGAWLMSF